MVCHHCGVKRHGVNECPKLTHAHGKQLWDDHNKAWREEANTASNEGISHAAVDKDANTADDAAARVEYERYQSLMSAMEELDIGMVQVVHSDTGFVEDTKAGVNLLSRGTSNTGKQVYFTQNTEHVSKQFTLDAHKLYLDSCATYHS